MPPRRAHATPRPSPPAAELAAHYPRLTLLELAAHYRADPTTVRRWLVAAGFEVRPVGRPRVGGPLALLADLREFVADNPVAAALLALALPGKPTRYDQLRPVVRALRPLGFRSPHER